MATPTSFLQVRLPVIVGSGDVNYCLNPSAEDGTGSTPTNMFTFGTATVTRSTTYARQVTPDSSYSYHIVTSAVNSGIQLVTASLPTGNIYMSGWIRGTFTAANIRFYNATGSQILTPTLYETDGAWTWFVLDTTPITSASGQTAVFVVHTTSGADFYLDDVVVQAGALTTSFHGSYPGCRWNGSGIAHQNSSTLVPLVENQPNPAAGVIYDIDSATTTVVSHYIAKAVGLGLPDIENMTQETVGQGKRYVSSQLGPRNIALNSTLVTTSISNQHTQRASLIDYLPPGRKFILRYRGNPTYNGGTADVVEVECVYQAGLAGNLELPGFEGLSLTLTAHDPVMKPSSETATALSMAQTQTLAYIARRSLGDWTSPNSGPGVLPRVIVAGPKGHLFVGGSGGTSNLKGLTSTTWSDCGVMLGGTLEMYAAAFDPSGTYLYCGGAWTTSIGGVLNTVRIARYALPASGTSGGTWTAMSVGANGTVRAIVVVPTSSGHDVYAFGDFTTIGGTSCNYAAKWNGSAWSALGSNTATATGIYCAVYDQSNYIYFGGSVTSIGTLSTPSAPTVANASGSLASGTWTYKILLRTNTGRTAISSASSIGTAATGKTLTLPNTTGSTHIEIFRSNSSGGGGTHYYLATVAKGVTSFTDDGTITLSSISESNYTTATDGTRTTNVGRYSIVDNCFEYVGTSGVNGTMWAMALAQTGDLYGGGSFVTADGLTVNYVAQYNGQTWSGMGDGLSGGDVRSLLILPTGEVAVGGVFTSTVNTLVGSLATYLAIWIPSQGGAGTWAPVDLTAPASGYVQAQAIDLNDDWWVGFDASASTTTSVSTTVTASGMAGAFQSFPRAYIQGPGILRYIENATTGHRIWFNLPVSTDEVVTLDWRLGYKSMTSSLRSAPRASKFIAGDYDLIGLLNGANKWIVYMSGTSGNATIRLSDPSTRLSADG